MLNLAIVTLGLCQCLSILLEFVAKVLFVQKDIVVVCPVVEAVLHLAHRHQELPQVRVSCWGLDLEFGARLKRGVSPSTTKTALAFRRSPKTASRRSPCEGCETTGGTAESGGGPLDHEGFEGISLDGLVVARYVGCMDSRAWTASCCE